MKKYLFVSLSMLSYVVCSGSKPTTVQGMAYVDVYPQESVYSVNSEGYDIYDGYCFPEYENDDRIITSAYKPFTVDTVGVFIWKKDFGSPLDVGAFFKFYPRIYAKNIKSMVLTVEFVDSTFIECMLNQLTDGYIIPKYMWRLKGHDDSQIDTDEAAGLKIKGFSMVAYARDPQKDTDIAIGDLSVYKIWHETRGFYHPFFCQAAGLGYTPMFDSFDQTEPNELLSSFSDYSWDDNSHSLMQIGDGMADTDSTIKLIFKQVFEKYPFYAERAVDKKEVIGKFNAVCEDTLTGPRLWYAISEIVKPINDPHFRMFQVPGDPEPPKKSLGPVRVQEFFDRYYVTAVFDKTLKASIWPGQEIVRIDNMSIDSMLKATAGGVGNAKKRVAAMFSRTMSDSILLHVLKGADTIGVKVRYDAKQVVPGNYRPVHGKTEVSKDGKTVYFNINSWGLDVNHLICNKISAFQEAENLIVDLRNNPGGHSLATTRFLSMFISRPTPYVHHIYRWDDLNLIRETNVIKPHPYYDLSHLNVYILVNSNTVCASEQFIEFLKTNHASRTWVIGSDKTRGALANVYTLTFENGYTCNINSLVTPYNVSGVSIENSGLSPDIWVTPMNVNDLAPYGDKVKKTAYIMIGHKSDGKPSR